MHMKKIIYVLIAAASAVLLSGCSDYLSRASKTSMTDENYWTSEDNIRLFVNGGYGNYFTGYNTGYSHAFAPAVCEQEYSDAATCSGALPDLVATYANQTVNVGESVSWNSQTGGVYWNMGWVRKWNLLIERMEAQYKAGVFTKETYEHWKGVGLFLRAYEYYRLVCSYGDVIWYDHVIGSADIDDQYRDRDPRITVMKHVMDDLTDAVKMVRVNDGENYINKYVVAAIASRIMLFEGTWYIYHKNDEAMKTCGDAATISAAAKEFLEKAVEFGDVVINSGKYSCNVPFRNLFGCETTADAGKEALLYREYNYSLGISHSVCTYCTFSSQTCSANLSQLQSWICTDGKPYNQSSVQHASSWQVDSMALTRDPRFESTFWYQNYGGNTGIFCTKFIDRVGPELALQGGTLPSDYYDKQNEAGVAVVRYAEVLLNWIEAKAELAYKFDAAAVTDADLNKSINVIRNRPLDATATAFGVQKTAPLTMAIVNSIEDPVRTSTVEANTHAGVVSSKLIWEIRRERQMEFCMEHFRTVDIRRWGKLELMQGSTNPAILAGAWIDHSKTMTLRKPWSQLEVSNVGKVSVYTDLSLTTKVTYNGSNDAELVGFFIPINSKDRNTQISEKHYLAPISSKLIEQYVQKGYTITQNYGWETGTN